MFKLLFLTCAIAQLTIAYPRGTKIIGGQESTQGQFPYLVSLQDQRTKNHFCGGCILSERIIVTAGHCFKGNEDAADSVVYAGSNDLSSGGVYYKLEKVLVHEDFNTNSVVNDITLLKTAEPIIYGDNVGPLKLPAVDQDIPEGTTVTALGWGTIRYPIQKYPDISHFVPIDVVSNEVCSNKLATDIVDSQICVGTVKGEGLCYGDSGSPLVLNGDTTIGIVSWGRPCAKGLPDVFTRTSSFVNWVTKNSQVLMNEQ